MHGAGRGSAEDHTPDDAVQGKRPIEQYLYVK